jgi:hypothetical protein
MKYIKIENGAPKNYLIENFDTDHPGVNLYINSTDPDLDLLSKYNVYPLITTNPPIVGEIEVAEEGLPNLHNDEWYQTWVVRTLDQAEINAAIESRTTVPVDVEIAKSFFVPEELVNQRSEICNSCPSHNILKICLECSCITPLKIRIKSATCPIGKW